MRTVVKKENVRRRGYSSGEIPRSIRWRGSNFKYAKQLAQREHRSLNGWINLMVERLWVQTRAKDTMA